MAVPVNTVRDLANWANSKSCNQWKTDQSCGHAGCVQDQRAVDILTALVMTAPGTWTLVESQIRFTA